MSRGVAFLFLIACASPALAQGSASAVPEPGAILLFMSGVAGLIVGRSASRGGPRDDA